MPLQPMPLIAPLRWETLVSSVSIRRWEAQPYNGGTVDQAVLQERRPHCRCARRPSRLSAPTSFSRGTGGLVRGQEEQSAIGKDPRERPE